MLLSSCCNAEIRYLDCEDCRAKHIECIDVCSKCGAEVEKFFDPAVNDSIKDMEEEEKAFPSDKE